MRDTASCRSAQHILRRATEAERETRAAGAARAAAPELFDALPQAFGLPARGVRAGPIRAPARVREGQGPASGPWPARTEGIGGAAGPSGGSATQRGLSPVAPASQPPSPP